MKKLLSMIIVGALALTLAGCSQESKAVDDKGASVTINSEFNGESMKTIRGVNVEFENANIISSSDMGLMFVIPETWNRFWETNMNFAIGNNFEIYGIYMSDKTAEDIMNFDPETSSQEDALKIVNSMYNFMVIYRVEKGNQDSVASAKIYTEQYEKNQLLVDDGKYEYYISYNENIGSAVLDEKDMENVNVLQSSIDAIRDNTIIFPVPENAAAQADLSSFSSTDINGNPVDNKIFSDYDLTMVNVWTTWCGFCITEMPELQTLYTELPENINLISICGDADTEGELAKSILAESKAEFTTIVANDEINSGFMQNITGFPTTVFVDKEGKIVGEPQVGAPRGDIVEGYMALINDRLSLVK